MKINRRDFLKSATGAAGTAAISDAAGWLSPALSAQASGSSALPDPARSGIEHIVVVMMENRSFDHYLGWLPNADGRQAGLTYTDRNGIIHPTHPLAPDFTGCGHPDPDHSWDGGRQQYNGGAMDGFLRSGNNDDYAIGYYGENDRPFFNALALNYTTLDRSFCSILGPTFPNRIFLYAAQTDRLSNTFQLSALPTIWDRLISAGVSARYYFSNIPALLLWGLKYIPISSPYAAFLEDAALNRLPAVSFVDPTFTIFDDGTGRDDHPHSDVRRGDAFLAETFQAVANSAAWPSTVFVVTYDEWGGFFDHVAPPRAIAPNNVDPDLVRGKALLGFRVPTVVASPFSRGNPNSPKVKSMIFDHTSILKLIEWRFGLQPLTARDASNDVQNLARALNFHQFDGSVPDLPIPIEPPPVFCSGEAELLRAPASQVRAGGWRGAYDSGLLEGWSLP